MDYSRIIADIDAEIERLQKARSALASVNISSGARVTGASGTRKGRRGRLSAAARKRISDAKKKWWAARKKRA